jgi:hypothetical protein
LLNPLRGPFRKLRGPQRILACCRQYRVGRRQIFDEAANASKSQEHIQSYRSQEQDER